jgi:hypothetical protein
VHTTALPDENRSTDSQTAQPADANGRVPVLVLSRRGGLASVAWKADDTAHPRRTSENVDIDAAPQAC